MRTKLQQIQISGSLAPNDRVNIASYSAANRTLVDDLNALRTQVKNVLGESSWLGSAAINLHDIQADFAGELDLNDLKVAGMLGVTGASQFGGAVAMDSSLGVTGAVSLASTLDVAHKASLADALEVQGASDLHGAVKMYGAAEINGPASLKDTLDVLGTSDLHGAVKMYGAADLKSSLAVAGAASLATLGVSGAAQFGAAVTMDSSLGVTGAVSLASTLDVADKASLADALEVQGASDLHGDVKAWGKLEVVSDAHFDANIKVDRLARMGTARVDSLQNKQIVFADVNGELKGADNLQWDTGGLYVSAVISGSSNIYAGGEIHAAQDISSAVSVTAPDVYVSNLTASRVTFAGADGKLVDSAELSFGNHQLTIGVSGGQVADLQVYGAAAVSGDAQIGGNVSAVDASFSGNLDVTGNATIHGNLNVLGQVASISTTNATVADPFIFLASGSASVDAGIVINKTGADLLLTSLASDAELFVAAKKDMMGGSVNTSADAKLIAMKAGEWQIGAMGADANSAAVGFLSGAAGGIELHAEDDMVLSVGSKSLQFAKKTNSTNEINTFESQFGVGTSLIGALVAAGQGGNTKKGVLAPAAPRHGVRIDFSSVGSLRGLVDADIDVYLNGILQSSVGAGTDDVVLDSVSTFHFTEIDIIEDDVITVIIRNAAL